MSKAEHPLGRDLGNRGGKERKKYVHRVQEKREKRGGTGQARVKNSSFLDLSTGPN